MLEKATESQTQFDALMYKAELLTQHSNRTLAAIRLVRSTAYEAATHFIWLTENNRDFLLKQVRNLGKGGLDKWLDKVFQPLTTLTGDNYHQLIDCISNKGMTQEEYRDKTPLDFINEWREKRNAETRTLTGGKVTVGKSSLRPSTRVSTRPHKTSTATVDYRAKYEESQREIKKLTRERDMWKKRFENLQKSMKPSVKSRRTA